MRRVGDTGLAVTCRFVGSYDRLAPAASEAAYRIVQEGLTNALKHAPGTPVDITVCSQDAEVKVNVVNAAPRQRLSGLERSGGASAWLTCGTGPPPAAGAWPAVPPRPAAGRSPRCCRPRATCRDTLRAVKHGWQAGEFWRVGPRQIRRGRAECNKAPSTYEMEGALHGRRTRSASCPAYPALRAARQCQTPAKESGFPASPTFRSFPRWYPFPNGKVIFTPFPRRRQEPRPTYFCSFLNPHDIHRK